LGKTQTIVATPADNDKRARSFCGRMKNGCALAGFIGKMIGMRIQLTKPELETFIDEQVKSGCFPTHEAAIEAAVEFMMLQGTAFEDLDPATQATIERAEAQAERGEGMPADEAFSLLRQKHLGK
jgi:Arc/MetJ-type ribon-helix-helix transcriptional regulator